MRMCLGVCSAIIRDIGTGEPAAHSQTVSVTVFCGRIIYARTQLCLCVCLHVACRYSIAYLLLRGSYWWDRLWLGVGSPVLASNLADLAVVRRWLLW